MAHEQLAADIVRMVGGESNIREVAHCITRLRFKLADESLAKTDAIKQLDKVTGVVQANGQYQVVIGPDVKDVFDAVEAHLGASGSKGADSSSAAGETKEGMSLQGAINALASIFTPTIPALAGSGIIKGLLVLATTLGVLTSEDTTYQILNAAGDAVFYFMPIILGYTTAKRMKCDPVVAMAIGGSLVYPNLVTLLTSGDPVTFLSIPVVATTYASTVIPIILATLVYSYLERLLTKVLPAMVRSVLSPTISLAIMVPATLLIFGPFGNYTSEFIGGVFTSVTAFSPLIAGAFFGGTYPLLVMFGMHRALVPIGINEVATLGSTALWAFTGPANFSQAGAALGAFFRLKDKKMKSVAFSSFVTALCGITEPALYAINVRYKRPMIAVVIAGAVGGAIAGIGGARAYAVAIPSLLTLPAFLGAGFVAFLISVAVAFVLACVLTVIMGLDESAE